MPDENVPFAIVPEGLKVNVQLTPKAKRTRLDGVVSDAGGGAVLKISVTAAPEKGRANEAMIKALAKTWKIPKTRFFVAAGSKNRRKTVLIEGNGAELAERVSQWLGQLDG